MLYDIYFHNDFDGRAAAAVMLAFLRSRGDDIEHFAPVNYYLFDDYLKDDFFETHKLFKGKSSSAKASKGKRNPAIVVDFPFHPKAAWWFDHHGTPCRKKSWLKKFKLTPAGIPFGKKNIKRWYHDAEYVSCCGQVAAVLKREFGWVAPVKPFKELIYWGDILDGANYKSARQTIELKDPALQVGTFFELNPFKPITHKTFIELLAEKPLSVIAKRPEVRATVREAHKMTKLSLKYVKDHLAIAGRAAHISFPSLEYSKSRYIPYFLYPKLLYVVRTFPKDGIYQLSVGQNPWRRTENHVNIGQILAPYGGGGHQGVGAAQNTSKQYIEKAAAEVFEYLANVSKSKTHGAKNKK